MNVIVNIIGVALIVGIIYWFWLARPKSQRITSDVTDIVVEDGVYTPASVEVQAGQSVTLRFLRKDPSPCAARVIFEGLDIAADLELGKPVDIRLCIDEPGEYPFSCEMQMYRGVLKVTD